MDGLLLESEAVFRYHFNEACRTFDLPDLDFLYLEMIGLNARKTRDYLQEKLPQHVQLFEFWDRWNEAYQTHVKTQGIPQKPYAEEVLGAIKDQGIPIAIATSTRTESAELKLAKAGLIHHIDCIIGGDRVEHGKPHPETYIIAARSINADPRECAAFEDSNIGIRAAVASGANAVQIPDIVPPTDEVKSLGHMIATDLRDAARMLGLWPKDE